MGLIAAVAVPALYFGVQFAAAPFYAGYSFSGQQASDLGTSISMHPWIFNIGVLLAGLMALPGAVGVYVVLCRGGNRLAALLCGVTLAATGLMAIRAGLFPLPDPRHASWDSFLIILPN